MKSKASHISLHYYSFPARIGSRGKFKDLISSADINK